MPGCDLLGPSTLVEEFFSQGYVAGTDFINLLMPGEDYFILLHAFNELFSCICFPAVFITEYILFLFHIQKNFMVPHLLL